MLNKFLIIKFISISFVFATNPNYKNECKSNYKGECCDKFYEVMDYPMICAEYFAYEIYANYLNSNPNLAGIIFLDFMVNDSGFVVSDRIFLSTMENKKFDEDIRNMLRKHKWKKVYIKESPWQVKVDSIYKVKTSFTFGKQKKSIDLQLKSR